MSVRTTGKRRVAAGGRRLVLNVQARRSTATRVRRRRISAWVFTIAAWTFLLGASGYSIHMLIDRFFLSNPEYNLREVRTELDGILTRDEVLEITDFAEGTNIFRLDLGAAERRLRAVPDVRDARIERILPDTLDIRIAARRPLAWVVEDPSGSLSGAFLVDESRFFYQPRRSLPEYFHLPIIYGVRSAEILRGEPLHVSELEKALQLLRETGDRTTLDISFRTVDLTQGWCMEATTDEGATLTFATRNLPAQLERLEKLLEYCNTYNRRLDSANLIPARNIPVRFIMASETATRSKP